MIPYYYGGIVHQYGEVNSLDNVDTILDLIDLYCEIAEEVSNEEMDTCGDK